jgi:hypothetical protein
VIPREQQLLPSRLPLQNIVIAGMCVSDFQNAELKVLGIGYSFVSQQSPKFPVAAMTSLRICTPATPDTFISSCATDV